MAVCFRKRLRSFGNIVPAIKNGVLYDCLDGVYSLKGLEARRRGGRKAESGKNIHRRARRDRRERKKIVGWLRQKTANDKKQEK